MEQAQASLLVNERIHTAEVSSAEAAYPGWPPAKCEKVKTDE